MRSFFSVKFEILD